MGSFTELTLAFTFSTATPPEVLSAFGDWRTGEGAPDLPLFHELLDAEEFDADAYIGNYFGEGPPPIASLPLLHRAAMWRYVMEWADNAYFPGTPATALRWDRYGERWTLTTRALPKEPGEWVQSIIASLGEWADEGSERPRFAGYLIDEYTPRPVLIWSVGGEPFQFEGSFEEA